MENSGSHRRQIELARKRCLEDGVEDSSPNILAVLQGQRPRFAQTRRRITWALACLGPFLTIAMIATADPVEQLLKLLSGVAIFGALAMGAVENW